LKLLRRQFLHLAAGAAALPTVSRIARAQTYPARPVRLIVGFGAGSAPDIVTRLIGEFLSERLGQQFIVDNRPGPGSNIATAAVARASPDGYTLLWATSANAISASLYDNLTFSFIRDIVPVAGVIRIPNLMAVSLSVPVKTVPEFIAYAKGNPGKLNFGAPTGTTPHLAGELFKMMSGTNVVHVPYRVQMQAVTDLLAERIQVSFDAMPTTIEYVRAGKLRALAVTTATRSDALLDIPTVGEFVAGYEASSWHGVGAPKNTPAGIVDKLSKEINAALADPRLKARLTDLGGTVLAGSPADFGKLIVDESEKWGKVVKFADIKPD
jgi:tripartite-type tricarboxylate transporter receptor subunit TctC